MKKIIVIIAGILFIAVGIFLFISGKNQEKRCTVEAVGTVVEIIEDISRDSDGDETYSFGMVDAVIGITFQWTRADTVYDLYGSSIVMGASGGPLWYLGTAVIYFGDQNDYKNPDGYQFTAGFGIGLDLHFMKTTTFSLKLFKDFFSSKKEKNRTRTIIHSNYNQKRLIC